MNSLYKIKKAHGLKQLFEINGFKVLTVSWPLVYGQSIFIVNALNDEEPLGHIVIMDANRNNDMYQQGSGTYVISLIYLKSEIRRHGISLAIIKWLLNSGVKIRTDTMMTPDGKALWLKLISLPEYKSIIEHNGIVVSK